MNHRKSRYAGPFERAAAARFAVCLLSFLGLPGLLSANTELEIVLNAAETLVVSGERNLDFGGVLIGAGEQTIEKTDSRAGLFTISGTSNRRVTVTLDPPSVLGNGAGDGISYTWQAAYRNHGTANDDPSNTTDFPSSGTTTFRIVSQAEATGKPVQASAYVWIFGSIEVGNDIPAGTYSGTFTLTAEYAMGAPGGSPPGGGPP